MLAWHTFDSEPKYPSFGKSYGICVLAYVSTGSEYTEHTHRLEFFDWWERLDPPDPIEFIHESNSMDPKYRDEAKAEAEAGDGGERAWEWEPEWPSSGEDLRYCFTARLSKQTPYTTYHNYYRFFWAGRRFLVLNKQGD